MDRAKLVPRLRRFPGRSDLPDGHTRSDTLHKTLCCKGRKAGRPHYRGGEFVKALLCANHTGCQRRFAAGLPAGGQRVLVPSHIGGG
jgi:hypothetical protein